jgi:predicted RNase H-like HicB family nuclease
MRMELTAVYLPVDDGGYVAWAEEFPGAHTQGETMEEAREMLEDAVRLLIDTARDRCSEYADAAGVIREPLVIEG